MDLRLQLGVMTKISFLFCSAVLDTYMTARDSMQPELARCAAAVTVVALSHVVIVLRIDVGPTRSPLSLRVGWQLALGYAITVDGRRDSPLVSHLETLLRLNGDIVMVIRSLVAAAPVLSQLTALESKCPNSLNAKMLCSVFGGKKNLNTHSFPANLLFVF